METAPPCRVTSLATGKGRMDKTRKFVSLYADLSPPAPTQVPALWLAGGRRSGGA